MIRILQLIALSSFLFLAATSAKAQFPFQRTSYDVPPSVDYDKLESTIRYPNDAIMLRKEGMITLGVLVNADGTATEVSGQFADSSAFSQEVRSVIHATMFVPATKTGKPVAALVSLRVRFTLEAPSEASDIPKTSVITIHPTAEQLQTLKSTIPPATPSTPATSPGPSITTGN